MPSDRYFLTSSFRRGLILPLSPILRDRRIENTAAASVEDTMAHQQSFDEGKIGYQVNKITYTKCG